MSKRSLIMLSIGVIIAIVTAVVTYYSYRPNAARINKFRQRVRGSLLICDL